MGIKGLNTFIGANFPGVMLPVQSRGGSMPYDHVAFDLNGIVHQACRKRGSEREVLKAVIAELDNLLRLFPAQRTVLIALDGPGPTAKLMEQRKRRIDKVAKAARDAEAAIPGSAEALRRAELARLEGRPTPAPKRNKRKGYDSLQVTPGTAFMLRLRRALEWYAASRVAGVGGVFRGRAPTVIVSAADVAGEGEIKLLEHVHSILREVRAPAAPPPSFLLVGPDADLLLLGLAAGTARCDVLTTDSEGAHKLFRVGALCEAFVAKASRPPKRSGQVAEQQPAIGRHAEPHVTGLEGGGVTIGGLVQLDFLVVAFLQGNDYLPKMRGAQLPRMWARLVSLTRAGEFAGQHLLRPSAARVEVNLPLLVRLVGGTRGGDRGGDRGGPMAMAVTRAGKGGGVIVGGGGGGGAAAEGEEGEGEEEGETDDDEDDEDEMDEGATGARRRCDVESYLNTLAWCACMYLSGRCPDYSVAYTSRAAPTSSQLAAHMASVEGATGQACRPAYEVPTAAAAGGRALRPDVFSLCLLPAAAAPYLPAPLQRLMDPSHELADIFHGNLVWPPRLVERVTSAVDAIPQADFGAEELEATRLGPVSVWAPARQGRPTVNDRLFSGCQLMALRHPPSSPFGAKDTINNLSGVVCGRMPPDVEGSSMERWNWHTPGTATSNGALVGVSHAAVRPAATGDAHCPPPAQTPGQALLSLLTPPPAPAIGAALAPAVASFFAGAAASTAVAQEQHAPRPPSPGSLPPPPPSFLPARPQPGGTRPHEPPAALPPLPFSMAQLEATLLAMQPAIMTPGGPAAVPVACAECGCGPASQSRLPLFVDAADGHLYCRACWRSYYGCEPPSNARDVRT